MENYTFVTLYHTLRRTPLRQKRFNGLEIFLNEIRLAGKLRFCKEDSCLFLVEKKNVK